VVWPDAATEFSIPAWILERWKRHYGWEAAAAVARAALEEPDTALNPATGRQQNAGAQSVVPHLELQAGMTLLDLCAAPGNKTAQALAAGARVVACDRSIARLKPVPAEARRVTLDATRRLPFSAKFDRVLIDAPCSGTGTLARNPEIKWRLRPEDFARFAGLQRAILEQGLHHLKSEGVLVYATCSLEPEENEQVVAGLPVRDTHVRLPGRDPGDGFFTAVITLGRELA
jgi:16S rRNA (cytosine967-C5)-methyltransferase